MAVSVPLDLRSFVGRLGERTEVERLLATTRLLTLTGPGGVGKTRLAFEVAVLASSNYSDGILVVELASLNDPDLVAPSIAAAVGLLNTPTDQLHQALVASLAPRQVRWSSTTVSTWSSMLLAWRTCSCVSAGGSRS